MADDIDDGDVSHGSNYLYSLSNELKKPKESMLGRKLMVKFNVYHKPQWFKGTVNAYDGLTGKYGVYFPSDKINVHDYNTTNEHNKNIRIYAEQNIANSHCTI